MGMRKYKQELLNCPLFEGIEWEEITRVMECLRPKLLEVPAGERVFSRGGKPEYLWVVLQGKVEVQEEDVLGGVRAVQTAEPGAMVGYLYACAGLAELPVAAVAAEDSVVLRLDCRRVMTTCDHSCRYHKRLARNLMRLVARGNLEYQQKAYLLSRRTTREKLMTYLLEEANRQGSREFTIAMDRQQLANYLCVERSAMSTEISRLCKDGVIECRRSWFKLLG